MIKYAETVFLKLLRSPGINSSTGVEFATSSSQWEGIDS
jgi:hypothetical protein